MNAAASATLSSDSNDFSITNLGFVLVSLSALIHKVDRRIESGGFSFQGSVVRFLKVWGVNDRHAPGIWTDDDSYGYKAGRLFTGQAKIQDAVVLINQVRHGVFASKSPARSKAPEQRNILQI